jgi:HTH-type transcriptional regulator / antitoxin HigA
MPAPVKRRRLFVGSEDQREGEAQDLKGDMEIKPIKNTRDYRSALKQIEGLMHAKRNTPAGDRLDVLVVLVEASEAKHYRLDLPDPIETIKYHMEQKGLSAHDLIPFIGRRNRVYEVLARKRPLTLKMIWRLHKGLGIPAESLIKGGRLQAA